jgi:hypothetical protein
MKRNPRTRTTPTCLLAIVMMAMGAAKIGQAAAPALQGQVAIRPLTPQEIKTYSLTGLQGADGLANVGLGRPAYLDALVNIAVPAADITNVTWALTYKPIASTAALQDSPLGADVPPFKMADRVSLRLAGRALLRPDVEGQYTVTATIATASSGTTNVSRIITASTYLGVNKCALCHSGGIGAPNMVEPWSHTPHATFFAKAIDGKESDRYGKNCISCHTVGYDANTNAVNGGFDDVATLLGWTFPAVVTNGNWAAMPHALTNLASIQCENCHGPGSQHGYALGATDRITVSYGAGTCGQCHDSLPHHYRNAEWNASRHAVATRTPSGPNRNNCVRCHTAGGFVSYLDQSSVTNTTYEAITCQACHDPHEDSQPSQLRNALNVTLADGTAVTNAGRGALCMNCHQSRAGEANRNVELYSQAKPTWINGVSFGPHDNPAADMLMGVNAITYGKDIPSSAHRQVVAEACVTCHMQPVAETDAAFLKAGDHTFRMSYDVVANGTTNTVEMLGVCTQCHGPIEEFNLARGDYNNDGVFEGVQDEVQHLLDKLSTLLPNANGVVDGKVQTSLAVRTNWAVKYLKGAYNWRFVSYDGSKGIHNAAYAVGLLKASIGDLTGDANSDSLPDAWQIQYFGSATNPNAAPTASPAGDGIPNWVKYALGLDPTVKGISIPGGVVWANGKSLVNPPINPGDTNTLAIFTAAEVAFNTEVGTTYQIQSIMPITGTWQNVGDPIPGTGTALSYVTPTRGNAQQFYRVVHTP